MKNIIAAIAISLSFIIAGAQPVKEADVPVIIRTAFAKMYPGINSAKWNKEDNRYKASFNNDKHKGSVMIDENGKWTMRKAAILVVGLPLKARVYINKCCRIEKILGISKIINATGEVQYETAFKGKKIFFTKEGDLIKTVKV